MHNETWHVVEIKLQLDIKHVMVKFKDLKDEIKEFRKHLEAVKERVDDSRKIKILHSYVDDLANPKAITNNWNMFLFERNENEQLICQFNKSNYLFNLTVFQMKIKIVNYQTVKKKEHLIHMEHIA